MCKFNFDQDRCIPLYDISNISVFKNDSYSSFAIPVHQLQSYTFTIHCNLFEKLSYTFTINNQYYESLPSPIYEYTTGWKEVRQEAYGPFLEPDILGTNVISGTGCVDRLIDHYLDYIISKCAPDIRFCDNIREDLKKYISYFPANSTGGLYDNEEHAYWKSKPKICYYTNFSWTKTWEFTDGWSGNMYSSPQTYDYGLYGIVYNNITDYFESCYEYSKTVNTMDKESITQIRDTITDIVENNMDMYRPSIRFVADGDTHTIRIYSVVYEISTYYHYY